jgi:hypothetical protein
MSLIIDISVGGMKHKLFAGDDKFFQTLLKRKKEFCFGKAHETRFVKTVNDLIGEWPTNWGLSWAGMRMLFIRTDGPDPIELLGHEMGHTLGHTLGINSKTGAEAVTGVITDFLISYENAKRQVTQQSNKKGKR